MVQKASDAPAYPEATTNVRAVALKTGIWTREVERTVGDPPQGRQKQVY